MSFGNFVTWISELGYLMRCLGLKFDPRQIERLILEFDENGSGGVEIDEFEKIIRNLVRIRNK